VDFPPFRLARYRFDLEAVDPIRLSAYPGSTFRGGFGYAFKKMVCREKDWRACTPCKGGNDCPYGYIFETTVPPGSQVLKSLREVPIPFVIEPPLNGPAVYSPGDRLGFDLLLVGRAIQYFPYFLLAFQELGRAGLGKEPGRYTVQRIQAVHPWRSTAELVYDGVDVRVGGRDLCITAADLAERAAALGKAARAGRLTLHFLTPTRLKHAGELAGGLDFHLVARALLRRFSSLAYFHCGQRWETDYAGWIEIAQRIETLPLSVAWQDWERFSGRQQQRVPLGGLVGKVSYRGDLAPFLPLLALGELIHVGKAAVFGNGWYQISL
jgi:hypothetical protein